MDDVLIIWVLEFTDNHLKRLVVFDDVPKSTEGPFYTPDTLRRKTLTEMKRGGLHSAKEIITLFRKKFCLFRSF